MKRNHSKRVLLLAGILVLVFGGFSPALSVVAEKPPPPTPSPSLEWGGSPAPQRCPAPRWIVKYTQGAAKPGNIQDFGDAAAQNLSQAGGMPVSFVREMSGGALVFAGSAAFTGDLSNNAQSMPAGDCISVEQAAAVAKAWSSLPDVEYAEPDSLRTIDLIPEAIAFSPDDTHYPKQWSLFNPASGSFGINAPGAWDITRGNGEVVVAVIDTGITNHIDLQGRFLTGYDFISDAWIANDGDGRDGDAHDPGDWVGANDCGPTSRAQSSSWHGTHVAGTIGASGNNATGISGINWSSPILPVRVLGRCGGYTSDIVDGMRWAAGLAVPGVPANPNKARVLNLSLSGTGACSQTESAAINDVIAAGAVVVVAAGNYNTDASGYSPAGCPGVITVAATERTGSRANYSNYGSTVELSAPGGYMSPSDPLGGVFSTLNTGTQGPLGDTYGYYQGTSMATPHVSGVASLLYSLVPNLTPAQVLQILRGTVTTFPPGSTCTISICGRGIVNASSAVSTLPRLTSLSPNKASTGSALTLTVNGANFNSSSKILWNGVIRETSVISSTQLKTQLTSSDLAASGTGSVSVTVQHPVYGSMTTSSLVFMVGLERSFYLPFIGRSVIYPPYAYNNVLVNGDFEAASAGWVAYSSSGFGIIRNSFPAPVYPLSGIYAAWLGGGNSENGSLQQAVMIDPALPYLTYSYWTISEDYCNSFYDEASIQVDGYKVIVYDLCNSLSTSGWVRQSVNLSEYAGKVVTLRIVVNTDFSLVSSWFLDNVAFSATP